MTTTGVSVDDVDDRIRGKFTTKWKRWRIIYIFKYYFTDKW